MRPAIDEKAHEDLRHAVELLEHPAFIAKLTDFLGKPVEKAIGALPAPLSDKVHKITQATLTRVLHMALKTMDGSFRGKPSTWTHKIAGGISGAIGGTLGLPALALELPVSTAIMLRSIADIARSQGEDISTVEGQLACLEVFALGSRSAEDDGAETGYFAVRAALAQAVSEAAKHIAKRGLTEQGAPVIVRLIAQLASRFGAVVSEKVAAQAVPVVGALGGATLNLLFVDHFQNMARGHFIVKRLERVYGAELVQNEYRKIWEESR